MHHESGDVLVADTNNHLVRRINATGMVYTAAGETALADPMPGTQPPVARPGCQRPCLKGVLGYRDGNSTRARFTYPRGVAVDVASSAGYAQTNGPYTIVVADNRAVRRGVPALGEHHSVHEFAGGAVADGGQVFTLAGTADEGWRDGAGDEATFLRPAGVVA